MRLPKSHQRKTVLPVNAGLNLAPPSTYSTQTLVLPVYSGLNPLKATGIVNSDLVLPTYVGLNPSTENILFP